MAPTPSYRVVAALLALSICPYALMQSMVIPALPRIQRELETDQATVAWVATIFLLSASVAAPLLGRLGDSRGKRRLMVAGISLFVAGAGLCAFAPTIEVLLAGRLLQGAAGAALPLAFGMARDLLPGSRLTTVIGLLSSLTAIGFAVGLALAGPMIDHLGYRFIFLVPAAMGIAALLGISMMLPESRHKTGERIPLTPAVWLATWLVALLYGTTQATTWGWSSWQLGVTAAITSAAFTSWVLTERRAAIPLVDLRMLTSRGVWTANLASLFIGVAMFGYNIYFPLFNQTPPSAGYGFGASVTEAGRMALPTAGLSFLLGTTTARLVRWRGARTIVALGSFILAIGILQAALMHEHKRDLYLAAAIVGIGLGMVFSSITIAVVSAVPPSQTGVASGMNSNIRTIGGAVGTTITGALVAAHPQVSGYPEEDGYTVAFLFLAVVAMLAALASLLMPARAAPSSEDRTDLFTEAPRAGVPEQPVSRDGSHVFAVLAPDTTIPPSTPTSPSRAHPRRPARRRSCEMS